MKSYEEAQAWLKSLKEDKRADEDALRALYADEPQKDDANEHIERFKRSSFDFMLGAVAAIRFIYGEDDSHGVR